jgi:hypothetical protein
LEENVVNATGAQMGSTDQKSQRRKISSYCSSNPFYLRPLIFRICLIPSQCKAFRYQGRISNFNFSDFCIFGGNSAPT